MQKGKNENKLFKDLSKQPTDCATQGMTMMFLETLKKIYLGQSVVDVSMVLRNGSNIGLVDINDWGSVDWDGVTILETIVRPRYVDAIGDNLRLQSVLGDYIHYYKECGGVPDDLFGNREE